MTSAPPWSRTLSPPASPRELVHARTTTCRGYRREDGLWDIEAHMTDVKSYTFRNAYRGMVPAGEPVHDMGLRLIVDDDLRIHGVEAVLAAGPFEVCPQIAPSFAALTGMQIGPGWNRKLHESFGGVKGCTHLVDLLKALATVAMQTIFPYRARAGGREEGKGNWAPHMNSCHALDTRGEVVKRHWPEFYTG